MDVNQKINAALVTLVLLALSSLGLAYEVYAAGQQPVHHMTYEEAVRPRKRTVVSNRLAAESGRLPYCHFDDS